ncbi:MAG: clan AA aspartic protease, partial [Candidatus Sumerlaeota bacterium]|nr:clan AA aspartic protease [Candidatus Sumerlaeota bacterium]
MGIIHVNLSLSNPRKPKLSSIKVQAVVDTGAFTLCIPEHVQIQLALEELERREVTIANGKKEEVS